VHVTSVSGTSGLAPGAAAAAGAAGATVAHNASSSEESAGLPWWAWLLIGLAMVGAVVGAYFYGRRHGGAGRDGAGGTGGLGQPPPSQDPGPSGETPGDDGEQ
jgi:hypothetical protein